MKNKFQNVSIARWSTQCLAVSLCFLFTQLSFASNELDRRFALESVGALDPWDNVDGLFIDYVKTAFRNYFQNQSRFRYVDIDRGVSVLRNSTIPYQNLIQDEKVLGQLSRSTGVQTLIRTKVMKEKHTFHFTMDWLLAPRMEVLSRTQFYLDEPKKGESLRVEEIQAELIKGLRGLVNAVPFKGHVTGRDRSWVTVNIGKDAYLKPGDVLLVSTLEEVKMHPLLKSAVDWRFKPTGRLQVDKTEDHLAFCSLLEQEEDLQVARFQKVVKIIPAAEGEPQVEKIKEMGPDGQYREGSAAGEVESKYEEPKLGWASGGLWTGPFSRQYSNTSSSKESSGFLFGGKAHLHLWLNRSMFADLDFGYGLISGGNVTKFQADLGYKYYLTGNFKGPYGWAKAGWQSKSYSLPVDTTELQGPATYSSIFVGIGGELPVRGNYSLDVGLDIGLLKSLTETGFTSGTDSGLTDATVTVGVSYELSPKMKIRVGMEIFINSAEFQSSSSSSSTSTGATMTHRVISFSPSLLYYF